MAVTVTGKGVSESTQPLLQMGCPVFPKFLSSLASEATKMISRELRTLRRGQRPVAVLMSAGFLERKFCWGLKLGGGGGRGGGGLVQMVQFPILSRRGTFPYHALIFET